MNMHRVLRYGTVCRTRFGSIKIAHVKIYYCFHCLKTKVHHKVHFDKLGTNFCSMTMKFVVVSSFLTAVASNPTEIPVLSWRDNTALTSNPTEIPLSSPTNNTWSNNTFPWNNETNTCLIECKADYGEWYQRLLSRREWMKPFILILFIQPNRLSQHLH